MHITEICPRSSNSYSWKMENMQKISILHRKMEIFCIFGSPKNGDPKMHIFWLPFHAHLQNAYRAAFRIQGCVCCICKVPVGSRIFLVHCRACSLIDLLPYWSYWSVHVRNHNPVDSILVLVSQSGQAYKPKAHTRNCMSRKRRPHPKPKHPHFALTPWIKSTQNHKPNLT